MITAESVILGILVLVMLVVNALTIRTFRTSRKVSVEAEHILLNTQELFNGISKDHTLYNEFVVWKNLKLRGYNLIEEVKDGEAEKTKGDVCH